MPLCTYTCAITQAHTHKQAHMGWLRLVGSLKVYVSVAEYRLFYRALSQKRPIILRSLLIVATPYTDIEGVETRAHEHVHKRTHSLAHTHTHTYTHHLSHTHAHAHAHTNTLTRTNTHAITCTHTHTHTVFQHYW